MKIRGEARTKHLAKAVLARANRPFASRRLTAALEQPGPYKVLIGCGRTRFDGWLPTDITWNAPMYLDATEPWPFPDASVSHVYGDNMIEYPGMEGVRALLRHALRVLRPGGVIRLASPDIERIARLYLDGPEEIVARCLAENRASGYEVHYPVDLLRNTFTEAGHQDGYLFDYASLSRELERAGFTDVRRCEAGESEDPALRGLEARLAEPDASRELVVEATKPA